MRIDRGELNDNGTSNQLNIINSNLEDANDR